MKHLALLALLALSACATSPKSEPTPVITRISCLPMKAYSREEQKKAADELEKLPANSELAKFVVDYGALRAANRACEASQDPPV